MHECGYQDRQRNSEDFPVHCSLQVSGYDGQRIRVIEE